jgi:hypothetical protein
MTNHEGADLHKRVERYEAAVEELLAAHREVKDVLTDHVLFERWEQIGAELGFSASPEPAQPPQRELAAVNHHEAWAS